MEETKKGILLKNFSVNEKYKVLLFIKKGSNAETYRVKGSDGKLYFLKLFNYSKLHRTAFDSNNNLLEIEILKSIKHTNIVAYKDSGELIFEGKKFGFLVLDFISGETLSERMTRERISTVYDIKLIVLGVLNGLKYLHTLPEPIIHNEITPQNIMLDLSSNIMQSKIIDFGYARSFNQSTKAFNKAGLNLNYVASECLTAGVYSPQSDLFSVGVIMYNLFFGMPPWVKVLSKFQAKRTEIEELILEERSKPLQSPNLNSEICDYDDSILKIIKKALSNDTDTRFKSAEDFIKALNGEVEIEGTKLSTKPEKKDHEKKNFGGFAAIAGMQELKDKLMNDVIELIIDKEGADEYRISMPNGMLLYGPPGCGKTFFAEKFAEETKFAYKYINPSELGTIYVHGTQEKIGKLFKEAREKAPFIICLDEVSSLFPRRDSASSHQIGEVDEFLTQLNNCGQDGVFVIATTNFPEIIDPAILRSGRLDIKIYIPPPDTKARKALFEMYLKGIRLDFGIDYEKLARITVNFVSSDIKLIVNEIARSLRKARGRVTMEILEQTINRRIPSVTLSEIKRYEQIRDEFDGIKKTDVTAKPFGFTIK